MGLTNEDLSDSGSMNHRSENPAAAPQASAPCLADCGFFGSPQLHGYCSQCYRYLEIQSITQQQQQAAEAADATSTANTATQQPPAKSPQIMAANAPAAGQIPANTTTQDDSTTLNDDALSNTMMNNDGQHQLGGVESSGELMMDVSTTREPISNALLPSSTAPETLNDPEQVPQPNNTANQATAVGASDQPAEEPQPAVVQKDRTRCYKCNARLKLTDMDCSCGLRFCSKHRYSDRHDCTFDYQQQQRERLKKGIPKVAPRNIKDF